MKSNNLWPAIGLLLLNIHAFPAFANVTYNYTGNQLETWFDGNNGVGLPQPYPISDPIRVSLTFSDNGEKLIDWAASQSRIGTISRASTATLSGGLSPLIGLQTDGTGAVTSWYISVYNAVPYQSSLYDTSLHSFKDMIAGQPAFYGPKNYESVVEVTAPSGNRMVTYWAATYAPGNWSSTRTLQSLNFYQSSVSPVPEPDTWAMLFAGLAIVSFAARKKLFGLTHESD
jgi:hypothetical protein